MKDQTSKVFSVLEIHHISLVAFVFLIYKKLSELTNFTKILHFLYVIPETEMDF